MIENNPPENLPVGDTKTPELQEFLKREEVKSDKNTANKALK